MKPAAAEQATKQASGTNPETRQAVIDALKQLEGTKSTLLKILRQS